MPNICHYLVSDEEFIDAVNLSTNIYQAILKLKMNPYGSSYITFKQRCKELNLSLKHFKPDSEIKKNITDDMIISSCKNNISRQSSLAQLGIMHNTGANIAWIKRKINELNIDTSHWLGSGHLLGKKHNWSSSVPLNELLVNGKILSGPRLKKRLIKANLLINKCYNCNLTDWLNQPISLQLEHKNGNHIDNRIENLTLLCPNCHSQTKTFCRRKSSLKKEPNHKSSKKKISKRYYCKCGKEIKNKSKTCRDCIPHATKINWPDINVLLSMIENNTQSFVSKQLGVSIAAIQKHILKIKRDNQI